MLLRGLFVPRPHATLSNSGSIAATQGTGIVVNPVLPGQTTNLVNTGTISGGNGVAISGNLGFTTITQAGGIIDGAINGSAGHFSFSGFALTVTGGRITGPIIGETEFFHGFSFSQASVNFDLGTGSFTTEGQIVVGGITVSSGTVVLANDVGSDAISSLLTNNAVLRINGARP